MIFQESEEESVEDGVTVIVDGYNLIHRLGLAENGDLEGGRNVLVEMLSAYGAMKRRQVTVVFDGATGPSGGPSGAKWVKILFSKPPRKADDIIFELARKHREGAIVVTDDNELAGRVESHGAVRARVSEFLDRVMMAHYATLKGELSEEPDDRREKKKGPAKRLPKKLRKRMKKLEKL